MDPEFVPVWKNPAETLDAARIAAQISESLVLNKNPPWCR
jgi:hypothetical protein